MRNEGAFEKWDPAEQTPVSPRGSSRTHLWVSSFCFSNSRLFRSCSFCLSRSASMDFCFCSCCLLCISLSSWEESGQVMKTWTEAHERLTSTQRFTVTKPRTLGGNFSGLTTVHLEIEITIFWHDWLPSSSQSTVQQAATRYVIFMTFICAAGDWIWDCTR